MENNTSSVEISRTHVGMPRVCTLVLCIKQANLVSIGRSINTLHDLA